MTHDPIVVAPVVDRLRSFTTVGWAGAGGFRIVNPGVTGDSCPICDAEDFGEEG